LHCRLLSAERAFHSPFLLPERVASHLEPEQRLPSTEAATEWLTKPNSACEAIPDFLTLGYTLLNLMTNPKIQSLMHRVSKRVQVIHAIHPVDDPAPHSRIFTGP
jgi:hypothetical protein